MHGVKRVRKTRDEARKAKEAAKLKEYLALVDQLMQKRAEKDYSQSALELTTSVLTWNPELYTVWNYRRKVSNRDCIPTVSGFIFNRKRSQSSSESILDLESSGLLDCLEDIDAIPVLGYQVFYGPRNVPIPYPDAAQDSKYAITNASMRKEGRSFHHGRFVMKLRAKAIAHPNVCCVEGSVKDLVSDGRRITGATITCKHMTEGETPSSSSTNEIYSSRLTILADGCFSKFRKAYLPSSVAPKTRSNFVGLVLKDAQMPAPMHGHVVLGGKGPILLYQIGTRDTRILIDVPGEKMLGTASGELKAYILEHVIPCLPESLKPALQEALDSEQRLRSMPNSFLPPTQQGRADASWTHVFCVGDALNMRHPLTGGGMTVGLTDAVLLTRLLMPSETNMDDWSSSLAPKLRRWHWQRKDLSSVVNILAQALYSLFSAEDANLEVLREGCFKYFELGGECVGGPVSLLSGLAPKPLLLVYHFFSVAIYSIWVLFAHPRVYSSTQAGAPPTLRRPTIVEYPGLLLRAIMVFYTACVVLLPVVWTELRTNLPAKQFSIRSALVYPVQSLVNKSRSDYYPIFAAVMLAGVASAVIGSKAWSTSNPAS